MLQINLQQLQKENVVIESTQEAFKDTPLENTGFRIEVKPLKKTEQTNILYKNIDDDGKVEQGDYQRDLFIESIVSADGIVDENQQPITIEKGIREIIWEYGDEALRQEILSAISSFRASEEKKSEQQEDALSGTPIGQ